MIECQLCNDWFHNTCIQNLQSVYMRKKQQMSQSSQTVATDWPQPQQHLICDLCSRGRRPKVETILTLLCSLQKLPVRLLDGELLQCLAERAINWQNRVREAIELHPDLDNAYNRAIKLQSDSTLDLSQKREEMAAEEATAQALLQLQRSQPIISHSSEMHSPSASTMVSNETMVSNTSPEVSPMKNKRKSPLILRGETAAQPLIELSPQSLELLSELLFEGNCLEVSLEETSHLWLVWQLSQPNYRTVLRNNNIEDTEFESNKRKSVSESDGETQNKKKKQLNGKEKVLKSGSKMKRNGKRGKSSDTDELCSMKDKCLKPNVAEVNWVYCEGGCEGWYHQLCIGIDNPDEIASLEKFYCIHCRQLKD
ncbi:unnamed protein product [Oppiella nova]|uniref:Zinc finger PHD-type domain-containing protein n=1 Tax=Oppiella nova TaxID=334625 RepID=A0A7R9M8U8_9ACAR|nr:unnamed protein product [Oppiella nova]CAG2172638.1 unnamed protein product [Oppiella nova]